MLLGLRIFAMMLRRFRSLGCFADLQALKVQCALTAASAWASARIPDATTAVRAGDVRSNSD